MRLILSIISLFVFSAEANEYAFPVYNYEKLIQIKPEKCHLNISNQQLVAQKHYEADVKLLAMEWMGAVPGLKDAQGIYPKLPGLALQNSMRHRDMYIFEKLATEVLKKEREMLMELGGNAAGNNYNRLQAKAHNNVVVKLKISLTNLEEMERTTLNILGAQTVRVNRRSDEGDPFDKGKYSKGFQSGLYEATYAPPGYERKHNGHCMWMYDRVIKKSDPYCGYVWSHGGNFYLERCPGDVHPFGMGHATAAGVKTVKELFNFKSVKKCKKVPVCQTGCFTNCLKKNQFDTKKQEKLVNGQCKALADPLFPSEVDEKTLTKDYLKDFKTFPEFYPPFAKNDRDERDVAKEIERYYLMTGEYEEKDCKSGKRKFLLEILDALKQLISLEKNLIEYYSTAAQCHIKLAEDIEEAAGVGVKHYARDQKETNENEEGGRAIVKDGGKKDKTILTPEEQKEAEASYFGLTIDEQNKLLKELITNDYKFTNDHVGLICKRSMKKSFCGGKKKK